MTIVTKIILSLICTFLCMLPLTFAADLALVNSRDWKDVYSVSLYTALTSRERTNYVTSESLLAASKTLTFNTSLKIYESESSPFIPRIDSQLKLAGYNVILSNKSANFNLDLDIHSGSYVLLSDSNFRTSIALAAYAANTRSWVLFVNETNLAQVTARIDGAKNVLAVGQFPRSVNIGISPYVTKTINNEDIYDDTQELAKLAGLGDTITLANGVILESEFFLTQNPVILSGYNRLLDDTYDFITKNDIKNVVIVGNQLTVVGEQIRSRSQKTISVYIKFAQSDTQNIGNIFALTFFPLPQPILGLNITKAIYDSKQKRIVAYFENTGNSGVYVLSTITVRQNGQEIGSASAPSTIFVAAKEVLPVFFDLDIAPQYLNAPLRGEFFTSYGASPSELDSFLTLENKFGPPFSIPITVESIPQDDSELYVVDAAYFSSQKKIGITVFGNSPNPVYYTIKINGLIVQGLKQDFAKSDIVGAQKEKRTYLSASLDNVDIQNNTVFPLTITYGSARGQEYKTLTVTPAFRTQASNIMLYVIAGIIALVVIILVLSAVLMRKKREFSSTKNR